MKVTIAIEGIITPLIYVENDVLLDVESDSGHEEWRGRFFSPDTGEEWKACSGPYGKGSAPKGIYHVRPPITLNEDEENKPFRDPSGNAWFAPMDPMKGFRSERSGLGIHPDGNVPGTLGCIGIKEEDTKGLLNFLSKAEGTVILYVV